MNQFLRHQLARALRENNLTDLEKELVNIDAITSIASLTDNSAGTVNDTIQAMPNPADAPASADILRDDIVANLLPALRNNIADLTAKVNAILSLLKDN